MSRSDAALATTAAAADSLALADPGAPERNPALVYLSALAPSSRRTMRTALNLIAHALLGVPRVYHPVERQTKYGPRQREWPSPGLVDTGVSLLPPAR